MAQARQRGTTRCNLACCPQCRDRTLLTEIVFPVAGEDGVTIRDAHCDRCGYLFSRLQVVTSASPQ